VAPGFLYRGIGGSFKTGSDDQITIDERIHSYKGVKAIIEFAFEYAQANGRKKVTLIDKDNVIIHGGRLWNRVFAEVRAKYPDIKHDYMHVDVNPTGTSLFEPVHGSAPDIVGTGNANPIAAFVTLAMLLSHIGYVDIGEAINKAVVQCIDKGHTTSDLGGEFSTDEVGDFVCAVVLGGGGGCR
jgi:3-isopropylmalate dehydrogenase